MTPGIGLAARHPPLANSKKSSHGATFLFRSATSMPRYSTAGITVENEIVASVRFS